MTIALQQNVASDAGLVADLPLTFNCRPQPTPPRGDPRTRLNAEAATGLWG